MVFRGGSAGDIETRWIVSTDFWGEGVGTDVLGCCLTSSFVTPTVTFIVGRSKFVLTIILSFSGVESNN